MSKKQKMKRHRHQIKGLTALLGLLLSMGVPTSLHAQETSGGFAGGSVKIGYDNRTCDGTLEGALRYNTTSDKLEYCDGNNWIRTDTVCDATPIEFTTPGFWSYTYSPSCTSITIEAFGAGGGGHVGGGGGGSVVLDGTTLLVTGGGGGGGSFNDGGGGGGYGTDTVTTASITEEAITIIVGGGGECDRGDGGIPEGTQYFSFSTSPIDNSIYGGGGTRYGGDAGDSTYGGGGGATSQSSANCTGGSSTYGGGGGANSSSSGICTHGTSTNGNPGVNDGGGGGGRFPAAGGSNGTDGNGSTPGTAANSGPGDGGNNSCLTAGDGKVVITPVP